MDKNQIDVRENYICKLDSELLTILLKDRSSKQNIIWATDDYAHLGLGYQNADQITLNAITGYNGNVIKPRTKKSKKDQAERSREKAEVFTPSWICNKQNNLVDNAWFGTDNVFNTESDRTWIATVEPINFPTISGRTWKDYVLDVRLEISCGEAPYLVSRYDTVSGESIDLSQRVGLLDRKLRVVSENTATKHEWLKWATEAFRSTYGYDWQGDNILLARENLLMTFIDYYTDKFNTEPEIKVLRSIADILSWNIWQMDGMKYIIPNSCKNAVAQQITLFEDETPNHKCVGCAMNDHNLHRGIYCIIKDWKNNKTVEFVSLLRKQ